MPYPGHFSVEINKQYISALERLYEWRPETAVDFVRKFSAWIGNPKQDGWPPKTLMISLVEDAHRLAA